MSVSFVKRLCLFGVSGLLALLTAVCHGQTIPADNANFTYIGRIDFADQAAPELSWPGTSIKTTFTGSHLTVWLDDDNGKNFFNVIIDGDVHSPYVIEAKKGKHAYWISNTLAAGRHSLEIYKRTEGEEGATRFLGLDLAAEGKLIAKPARPLRRIEIYGDSISSGMGNEGAFNGGDANLAEKNHYWSYGAIAARELDAELHTISQSGIGIMISWFPFIMPQFYDQLSAVGNNDSQWDFNQWSPDVVVVNLFQNDSWLVEKPERISPKPTKQETIQAYIDFVRSIRAKYPNVPIICALGSMDATREGSVWPEYIEQAVQQMESEFNDTQLHTLFFPFNGYGQHPRVAQHKYNAKLLVDKLQQVMDW